MAEHGGHRTPSKPAPVSGPGSLSKRTDGPTGHGQSLSAPTDMAYGDHQALIAQERTAPMAAMQATPTPQVAPSPQSPAAPGLSSAPGGTGYAGGAFDAPSNNPDEPVTNGVDSGPGAGSEAMSFNGPAQANPVAAPTGAMTQMLAGLSATDTTGTLAALYAAASALNV